MTEDLKKDIIQWDIHAWSKSLDYWESKVDWNTVQSGLELGGRKGGLSLWLALKGIKTVCSDLMDTKKLAEPLHQKYGVISLVEYQDIDASSIPYENQFDVIVFKSIVGGVGTKEDDEMKRQVFKEIYKALKPGGKLLFAENLAASSFHRFMRKRFINWNANWKYIPISEMRDFLKDFSSVEIKTTGVFGTFGRSEGQRKFLGTIDRFVFNHICPESWKYISYGIAVKPGAGE
ncbi:MAG TPA: methyltransferase domain-containing protein [Fluviicola sp.]|nr:methyltransferase domain-containing protein [Fluviicola sp.]